MKQMIKRFAAAVCAGLMLALCTAPAVLAEEAKTESTKLPSGRTLEDVKRDLQYIEGKNGRGDDYYAAALVGIFHGDEVLYTKYYGYADIANNIEADEDACFEWGSISKTFIWVSAFQLWEQGKLDLDRDVREYLPQGFFQHLSYDEPITMLHLMNHSAGWQETSRPIWKTDANAIGSLHDELQAIEPAQIHRPGEVYAYSNYGAAVAGYVIECITGQDYCSYVHEHIFEPLGMEHTALNPTHSDCPFVFAQRQRMHSYNIFTFTSKASDLGTKLDYIPCYPAGSACGTIADMIRYGQALVDDSAPLFADPATQEAMLTGTAFYGTSDIPMCCHGFWCTEYAVRTYGHTGGTTFGQADLEFDPVSKYGIAVMVNESGGNAFLSSLPNLVFGNLNPAVYGANPQGEANIRGYYLPARSVYSGMMRFEPYLTALHTDQLGLQKAEDIGSHVLQLTEHDAEKNEDHAGLIGVRYAADGSLYALESPSCDLLADKYYVAELFLLGAFMIGAVASVYMLLIRRKLKRAGRWTAYAGASAMTAGRIARLLSVLLMLTTYVVYIKFTGGIPYGAGQAIGIGQLLCIGVCAGAAVYCIAVMLTKKENHKPMRYLPHCVMNAFTVTAVLFFEMYKYWGI